jgi:hypothetical protein
VAIPLTSGSAPRCLIDGDRMLIVEPREGDSELVALGREADDPEVERGMVAAGGGRKGKRARYRSRAAQAREAERVSA